jgi:transposase
VQPRIVSLWRHRFADQGLAGLSDKPRPGKRPIYTKATDKRILRLLDKPPPQGFARWTGPLLADALGDVDVQYVWRFLRNHKIDLAARKSWCESNDPNFTAKAATGKIIAAHSKRRRRVEFLGFMNSVAAAFPNRQLHVILDNLNTHKKNEHWLKAHPDVQFHFTPTSASWLNQVETWFSILQGQSLSGASFTSLEQLKEHIDAFIHAYNEKAQPFVWTKKKVRQSRFKGRRITQL